MPSKSVRHRADELDHCNGDGTAHSPAEDGETMRLVADESQATFQLELFPETADAAFPAPAPGPLLRTPESLRDELSQLLRGRLGELVLTENQERILSSRHLHPGSRQLAVRLDASFLSAPPEALAAVAAWLLGSRAVRRSALARIREHFEAQRRELIHNHRKPPAPLRSQGEVHDLGALYLRLNGEHFDHCIDADITWGVKRPRRRRRTRRTIQLGIYRYDQRLIRIHPALDHHSVPEFVVASVLFHEMLHAWFPPPAQGGMRRCLHSPEFRRAERRFEFHDASQAWIRVHLDELLTRA